MSWKWSPCEEGRCNTIDNVVMLSVLMKVRDLKKIEKSALGNKKKIKGFCLFKNVTKLRGLCQRLRCRDRKYCRMCFSHFVSTANFIEFITHHSE